MKISLGKNEIVMRQISLASQKCLAMSTQVCWKMPGIYHKYGSYPSDFGSREIF